jgi:hypothetical protein
MLDQLKNKIKDFEQLQNEYEEFGATDTEPDAVFQSIIYHAAIGESVKLPVCAGWQLYRKKGVRKVVARLNEACKDVINVITSAPNKDRGKIKKYITEEYCWRIR